VHKLSRVKLLAAGKEQTFKTDVTVSLELCPLRIGCSSSVPDRLVLKTQAIQEFVSLMLAAFELTG
jgi:hypothetical protein